MSFEQLRTTLEYVWTHPANRKARVRAIARSVRFQVRGRVLGRQTIVPLGRTGRVLATVHRPGASKAAYANPPDYAEMMAWARILRPGDTFVDVGANAGLYSVWALDQGAAVIAVEPDRGTATLLQDNLALNSGRSEVHVCALGAESGVASFTIGLDAGNHFLPRGGTEVRVETFDDLLGDRVAAGVKIDVEGAEHLVLQGARRALADGRLRIIQMEWNQTSEQFYGETREPIIDLLREHGFEFMRPDEAGVLEPSDPSGYGTDLFAVCDAQAIP